MNVRLGRTVGRIMPTALDRCGERLSLSVKLWRKHMAENILFRDYTASDYIEFAEQSAGWI